MRTFESIMTIDYFPENVRMMNAYLKESLISIIIAFLSRNLNHFQLPGAQFLYFLFNLLSFFRRRKLWTDAILRSRIVHLIITMRFNIPNMARSILLAVIFVSGSLGQKAFGIHDHHEWAQFIDNQMKMLMGRHNLPNASVALVADGRIILMEGYGYTDMEAYSLVDPRNNLFRTGSVSKLLTWTAVMQLVEQGLIDLDRDINGYIDFPLPDKITSQNRNDLATPVTMRHLLSHTAGFEDVIEGLFRLRLADNLSLRDYLIKYMPARIFPPGEVLAYSNYGAALAGYIVERISGLPFGEYMDKQIFSPLGMRHSSFRQPLHVDLHEKLVGAYRKVDGEFQKGGFEYMPAPAGGLSTTAEDMALFMLEYLAPYNDGNGGTGIGEQPYDEINPVGTDGQVRETTEDTYKNRDGNILSDEMIRLMHSSLFAHHPLLGGMAYGFKEYSINGKNVVFHAGSSTLFDAGFYLLPEAGAGLFFCYSGGKYTGHIEVFNAFMQRFFTGNGEEFPADHVLETSASPAIDELKGEYQQSRRIETGPDKLLNLLSGVMIVSPYKEGELDVDLMVRRSAGGFIKEGTEEGFVIDLFGSSYRFEELYPGIFKNMDAPANYPFGPLQYLVADTDSRGRLMLATDGPVTFIRMPFHATSGFAAVLAGFSLLLVLATLSYYSVKGSVRFFFPKPDHGVDDKIEFPWAASRTARHIIILHAVLVVVMLIALAVTGNPDPVYQLPMAAFGYTSFLTRLLEILPPVLTLLAASITILCVFGWVKKWWKIPGRIYYSLYTLSAVSIAWLFWFYNLLVF